MNRFKLSLLLIAWALAGAVPAAAHPHVFVEMQTRIDIDPQGMMKGVSVTWSFDDAYAQVALEGMDANGDGTYSSEELALLTQENLESIKDYGYFTAIRQKGVPLKIAGPGASQQTYENNKLTLRFDLLLTAPADPKAGPLQIKFYDPEFFIAFDYAKASPASLSGNLPETCAMELKPLPSGEEIDRMRTFLADKPKDWKPEQEEDYGALFAQALMVTCA